MIRNGNVNQNHSYEPALKPYLSASSCFTSPTPIHLPCQDSAKICFSQKLPGLWLRMSPCLGWMTLLFQFSDSIRECGCQKRVVTRSALKPSLAITWFVKGHGPSNVQGRSSEWWVDEGLWSRFSLSSTSSTTPGNPGKGRGLHWPELSGFCTHFVLAHSFVLLPQR